MLETHAFHDYEEANPAPRGSTEIDPGLLEAEGVTAPLRLESDRGLNLQRRPSPD